MRTETEQPVPGTRPEGTGNEHDAGRYIRRMFSDIAGRYDLLNHLLTGNLDRLWRRRTAAAFDHILRLPHARVLDVCCGTGDLAIALKRRATRSRSSGAAVLAGDFAHPMLLRAAEKSRTGGAARAARTSEIGWFEADAFALPLAASSLDLITLAFGFRNLANYEAGLREFFRLLRPGGELGILECAEPRAPVFSPLYRFYFRRVVPLVGGAISGSAAAYSYLPASVQKFPDPDALVEMMRSAGFTAVSFQLWAAGAVAFHTAKRPR